MRSEIINKTVGLTLSIITIIVFLSGCTDSTYEEDEVLAEVKGEEITARDLRFYFRADIEDMEEALDMRIKELLLIKEAKESGVDLSDEVRKGVDSFGQYPSSDIETEQAEEIKEFAESQAEYFDMDPEEYYRQYQELRNETSAYISHFIEEKFGWPAEGADLDDLEAFDQKIEKWIDQLIEENQEEIDVYMD